MFVVVVISLLISALANFIYKGPDSKYFWLWSPDSLYHSAIIVLKAAIDPKNETNKQKTPQSPKR